MTPLLSWPFASPAVDRDAHESDVLPAVAAIEEVSIVVDEAHRVARLVGVDSKMLSASSITTCAILCVSHCELCRIGRTPELEIN